MRNGFAVGLMLLLSVGLLVIGGSQAHGESTKSTTVSVKPNKVVVFVNHTFSVDVWIDNVVDMAGWEIYILWDRSILRCVKDRVNTPTEWGGLPFDTFNVSMSDVNPDFQFTAWIFGRGIMNDFNETHGVYEKLEIRMPRQVSTFSGSLSVVTLTFQALQTGTTLLRFWSTSHGCGTAIANPAAEGIAVTELNGWVHVRAPIVMPIQHAQWLKR